jgi:hypothetical protein
LRPDAENITGIYLHIYQLDKSVVAEPSIEWGHQIRFKDTELLAKTVDYVDWLLKEAVEI